MLPAVAVAAATVGCGSREDSDSAAFVIDANGEQHAEQAINVGPAGPGPVLVDNGISFNSSTGIVTITGNSAIDTISISYYRGAVRVARNSFTELFAATDVDSIVVYGNAGNDDIDNGTSIPCVIEGGDGDDIIDGGSGDDFIVGGYGIDTIDGRGGDDEIWGSGGSDIIFGGLGDDVIKGHGGQDELHGGDGADRIYGGSGTNTVYGDAGMDTIVTIGAGVDTITGGAQWDNVWMDTTDVMTDTSVNENDLGYIHKVNQFFAISYSGGVTSTPVSKELDGADLADPLPDLDGTDVDLVNFKDEPLFGPSGPTKDDIFQGDVADCYFLANLSALAGTQPETIKKLVVDLGDGTYAVRFYDLDTGAAQYVRVDADLWTFESNGALRYADVSDEGAIWVSIVEKAYAFFRKKQGTYPSLGYGNGTLGDHLDAGKVAYEISDDLTPEQVLAWHEDGEPAGTIKNKVDAGVVALLEWIDARVDLGKPLSTGAKVTISDNTPIRLASGMLDSTWRRGEHIYQVDHVERDANGNPTALVLRDPWGVYRTISDFTRLYWCIGRASYLVMD